MKKSKTNPTEYVVFRVWKKFGGVIALWPAVPADNFGHYCQSYEHVGQHGAADYDYVIRQTRPAKPKEVAELTKELISIGYKPVPIKKTSPQLCQLRKEEAIVIPAHWASLDFSANIERE